MSARWKIALVILSTVLWYLCFVVANLLWGECTINDVITRGSLGYIIAMMILISIVLLFLRDNQSSVLHFLGIVAVVIVVFGYLLVTQTSGAVDRGRQKRTMADLRVIGGALDQYGANGSIIDLPSDINELHKVIGQELPTTDGWGNEYVLRITASEYTIISYGACGEPDVDTSSEYEYGSTDNFRSDVIFRNGEFQRWPEGAQQ